MSWFFESNIEPVEVEEVELPKPKKLNPFDCLNVISMKDGYDEIIMNPDFEKQYSAFMVNRGLSQFAETILYAQKMNESNLPAKMHFDFLYYSLPRKKRFGKWAKADSLSDDVELVSRYYNVGTERALEYLQLLSKDQLTKLKELTYEGGTK